MAVLPPPGPHSTLLRPPFLNAPLFRSHGHITSGPAIDWEERPERIVAVQEGAVEGGPDERAAAGLGPVGAHGLLPHPRAPCLYRQVSLLSMYNNISLISTD